MRRDTASLADREHDVAIVGGGIFGICCAWEAASRGLSVALVERDDFSHATSANSFKMVHGGIRYLQHLDLYRIRESCEERRTLLRVAPHLVGPLPIVIPTRGHGMRGREIMRVALAAYDLCTADRNRGIRDPAKRIPRGRILSRGECLTMFPGLDGRDLTGAALFHDGQMHNPPRLALAFLRSAVEAGAVVANYVEVAGFLRQGDRVVGVRALDTISDERIEIRARVVINAVGPWVEPLLANALGARLTPGLTFSRDACFVVGRRLLGDHALAVLGRTSDPDAVLSRGRRHLFIVPWRGYTLVGVWHVVYEGDPDRFTVTADELRAFIDEVNEAYPPLALRLEDVSMWNAGLVLFGENRPGAVNLSYGKRSKIVDHSRAHGLDGLVSVVGVRWTTARGVAARTLGLVFGKLGRKPPRSRTDLLPVFGGDIESFESFLEQAAAARPRSVKAEALRSLVRNHGTNYGSVLRLIEEDPSLARTLGGSTSIGAEVIHSVREEMAMKLEDVVFRRTDLGTGAHPGEEALLACADLLAREAGWSRERTETELRKVREAFPSFSPSGTG